MANLKSNNKVIFAQHGFGLIELMVALVLSLFLMAGVVAMFTSTKGTYEVNDRLARVEENGRFAMSSMVDVIRSAGYFGCTNQFDTGITPYSALNTPSDGSVLAFSYLQSAVMGFDFTAPATWSPTLDTSFVDSPADNGDVLVVRSPIPDKLPLQVITSMTAPTDAVLNVTPLAATAAPPFKAGQILMIANCSNRSFFQATAYVPTTGQISHAASGTFVPGNASLSLGTIYPGSGNGTLLDNSEGGPAIVVPVQTTIFYLKASSSGNGTSLWRKVDTNASEELVEGVDALQIKFGIDTTNDGAADQYVDPKDVTDPSLIVSVSIVILLRSIDEYGNISADTKQYDLFNDGTFIFTAPGDHRLRQIFTTTVTLRNYAL